MFRERLTQCWPGCQASLRLLLWQRFCKTVRNVSENYGTMADIRPQTGNGSAAERRSGTSPTSAGVSIATVSRVLNDRPDVAPDTREAVLQVVREHGFNTNRGARALSGGRTGLVGVTLPLSPTRYFGRSCRRGRGALRAGHADRALPDAATSTTARSRCSTG